jgi:integrase
MRCEPTGRIAWQRTPGGRSPIGCRRSSRFWGLGCPKIFHEIEDSLAHAKGGVRDVIQAGVQTGARRGELFALRVRDFDAEEGTLRIASGKTGARTVFLSDQAVEFFKKVAASKLPELHLLTKDDGTHWPEDDLTRPFKAAVRAAKLPPETTFYSLRHYHVSRALLAGVQPQVVAENCGTSLRMLEQHYGKFMKADRRAMFNGVVL